MKHLQLYEKVWNENSLKRLSKEKDIVYNLVKDYLIFTNNTLKNEDTILDVYYENIDDNECIIIKIFTTDNGIEYYQDAIIFDEDEVSDLYNFINNTEQYKNTKKYNL